MQHVFLMCSERSGSNLITRLMDAHPRVCGPTPTHLLRTLAENRLRYGDLRDERRWRRLLDDAVALLDTSLGAWTTRWTAGSLARAVPRRTLAALVRTVLDHEAAACHADTVFVKENHLYRFLPLIQSAFPDGKIVAMVRDPRDMALSWKNSPILRGDAVRAARVWREDQFHLLRVLGCLERERDIHLLSYENLIRDTAGELADICGFLGLQPDPAMIAFHDRRENAEAASRTDDWKNLSRPVMTANADKWRRALDADEIAYVEAVCGEIMEAFGYELESDSRQGVQEIEARLLPRERSQKDGYDTVPDAEKAQRRRRSELVAHISSAPIPAQLQRGEVPLQPTIRLSQPE